MGRSESGNLVLTRRTILGGIAGAAATAVAAPAFSAAPALLNGAGNLRSLKLNVVQDGISVKFSPDKEKHGELVAFGNSFATLISAPEG